MRIDICARSGVPLINLTVCGMYVYIQKYDAHASQRAIVCRVFLDGIDRVQRDFELCFRNPFVSQTD